MSTGAPSDHPHDDPGDGREKCDMCGKFVWAVTHSCKGVPVGPRIEIPFPVMTDAGFPHGLRCDACRRPIIEGQPYREDVESVYANGDTMAILRCVYCPSGITAASLKLVQGPSDG
jgi:hypothetical protein